MKLFGGESELRQDNIFYYLTDSGRSSLRLILRSGIKNKKFLIPNFLCKIIIDILEQEKVNYSFYNINENLSIDTKSIKNKEFDVLYVIDYFGQRFEDSNKIINNSKILIEDAAFLPEFKKPKDISKWIGFNGFRKILPVADVSLIQSTIKLNDNLICKGQAPFVNTKYRAKRLKFELIKKGIPGDDNYLKLFRKGENLIDKQRLIYTTSAKSLYLVMQFFRNIIKEKRIRKNNYQIISKELEDYVVRLDTNFYSFCLLKVPMRDKLKNYLFKKKIFLPVHWPKFYNFQGGLYTKFISIPLDSRYQEKDLKIISKTIKNFLKSRKVKMH